MEYCKNIVMPEYEAMVHSVAELLAQTHASEAAMVDGMFDQHGANFVRLYFASRAKDKSTEVYDSIAKKFCDLVFAAHEATQDFLNGDDTVDEAVKKAEKKVESKYNSPFTAKEVKKAKLKADTTPTAQELKDVYQKRKDFIDALAEKYARSGLYGDRKATQKAHEYLQAKVTAYGDADTEEKEDSAE